MRWAILSVLVLAVVGVAITLKARDSEPCGGLAPSPAFVATRHLPAGTRIVDGTYTVAPVCDARRNDVGVRGRVTTRDLQPGEEILPALG